MSLAKILLTSLGIAIGATELPTMAAAAGRNIVLVHGTNMDGQVWSDVYYKLKAGDYEVTVVQLPMTSVDDDIAATRRAISAQKGPVVLVGHSYGGMVISQAGTDSNVKALVYVAAFQPDIGESLAELNSSVPGELPQDAVNMFDDGYGVVRPDAWITYVANGLSEADARHTALFQTPVNTSIFGYMAEAAAWQNVPAWSAVAKQDRTVAPALQRRMSERSGATVVEIDGGHLLPMSHPADIAAIIEAAAATVK